MRSRLVLSLLILVGMPFGCAPRGSEPATVSSEAVDAPSRAPSSDFTADLVALTSDDFEGRAAGSPGGRLAAAYLKGRLEQAGLVPFGPAYSQPFSASRRDEQIQAANLVAVVPNRQLDQPPHDVTDCLHPLVVLTAHYDHLGIRDGQVFNGADDNASGVAVALRAAGLSVGDAPPFHLILALLDAEELGLQGARALLSGWNESVRERIIVNLNLDMVGRSDGGILWIAGGHHTPWLAAAIDDLEGFPDIEVRGGRDSPDSPPDWTESSDHAVFHRAGIPFLYFGVDDHADYHKASDDLEKLDLEFMNAVAQVIDLTLVAVGNHVDPPPADSSTPPSNAP